MSCQKNTYDIISKVSSLPKSLNEISGIVTLSDGNIYAINDSGNANEVFKLNNKGELIKKIVIPNSKNRDWEDLAYDKDDNLYIGDFGNNANNRKDLTIYKVSGILNNNIKVSEINFYFEDQKKFPPKKKNFNFDVEAFIFLNNSFYLFTKNRGDISKATTKLYKVPATSGTHKAVLIDSFKTCNDKSDCLITAATINRKKDKIALLTHNKVFLITNFNEENFFKGKVAKIKLNHTSQKEGICFYKQNKLFITDEKGRKKKAHLFKMNLN